MSSVTTKTHRIWFAFLAFAAIATLGADARPPADVRCGPVHGRIQSVFTAMHCLSPVGLCTAGTITGAGRLDGATTFLALAAAPSAGMPGIEAVKNLSYSGQLTVSTRHGTLVTRDIGVLDVGTATFAELDRAQGNASGVVFISGAIVNKGTAFDGQLSGELCFSRDD